jgi:hypothetical protein
MRQKQSRESVEGCGSIGGVKDFFENRLGKLYEK